MEKKVYVVTGFDLGWDCVVGVYDPEFITLEELSQEFPPDQYHICTNQSLSRKI